MRKLISLMAVTFTITSASAAVGDMEKLRKCFHMSVIDENLVDNFHSQVMMIENPDALQVAYQAASFALLAKKSWNPFEKISLIRRYGRMMDKAIEKSPKDIEIRFLRLSIDHYTPVILGRRSNVCSDKMLILELLTSISQFELDSSFNRFILYFLKHEEIYSEEELAIVVSRLQ